MGYYVGLDVSLKSTHICVLDGERRVVWRGVSDTQIAMIAEHLARWGEQIVLVGLETGSLTPWLYHGLSDLGLPMVCMDARRASDALKARAEKTDKADARALAEMLASGWYSAVHVKSLESHQLKALLGARDQLVRVKRQLYGQVRGLLRPFGIKISQRAGAPSLSMRLCEWPATRRTYSISRSAPCLTRLRTWRARSRSWTSRFALWRKRGRRAGI